MAKTYTVFPDIVFEGSLPLTSEIENQLNAAITAEANSGSVEETNYGFCTNKFVPLNKTLKNFATSTIDGKPDVLYGDVQDILGSYGAVRNNPLFNLGSL